MKKYDNEHQITQIICNSCGSTIAKMDKIEQSEYLSVRQRWGYFSKWDGAVHEFDLCTDCYEKMFSCWKYPPDEEQITELI